MARHRSSIAWLLLISSLLSCPLLLLALPANSIAPSADSTSTSSKYTDINFTSSFRSPVILTKSQLKDLKNDPLSAFLEHHSSHLRLDYGDLEAADVADGTLWALQWLPDLRLSQRIHQVTVEGYGSLTNFTAVASGLSQIERLEELHWLSQSPVPQSIILTIEDVHPDCKLFYNMRHSNWDIYEKDFVPIQGSGEETHRDIRATTRSMILGSPILHSLTTDIGYGSSPDLDSLPMIHHILATCPNLRELDLSIDHQGCVFSGYELYAFDFSGGSNFSIAALAPLESVRLSGYRFDNQLNGNRWPSSSWPNRSQLKWPWHALPNFALRLIPYPYQWRLEKDQVYDPDPPCPTVFNRTTNLDGWIQHMDFSKLTSLDLDGASPTTLRSLSPVLTSLTSLAVHGGDKCTAGALETFLNNSNVPLEHLHLCNIDFKSSDKLVDILAARHGQGLISLTLHESEQSREHYCYRENHTTCRTSSDGYSRGSWYDDHLYLNNSHLQQLQRSSPVIESLDIDLDRNLDSTSQADLLNTLGSFANLSSLVLRLESPSFQAIRKGQCDDELGCYEFTNGLHDPVINITWVTDAFNKIRSTQGRLHPASSQDPRKLRDFTVFVGRWASQDAYYYGMSVEDNSIVGRFQCNVVPVSEGSKTPERAAANCTGGIKWCSDRFNKYRSMMVDDEYGELDESIDALHALYEHLADAGTQ